MPMDHTFLRGCELGDIIAAFDWQATALGPLKDWPASLRITVGLILQSPVPIVTLWGEDGVMIYNDAYSVFAGGRHPRLLGSKVREGWPEVADFNDHVMKVGLAGGTLAYQDQELTLHRSGVPEQVWMNLDYSPILDEDGRPAGVIAIVVETTDKVRAQRWLNGERERLRRMFEQAPGFMALMTGAEHVVELTNPAYYQLVGHREVLGKPVRAALPEIEGQGFFELLDQVYRSGEAFMGTSLALWLQREPAAQPEERYVDLVYQPLRDDHGKVMGIFAQGTDVTDRVLAEHAVRSSEAKFRTLAQAMPHHVWTAPADGQRDWFNAQAYEYSGVAAGRLKGAGWAHIVHPVDLDASTASWAACVAEGTPYEAELRLRRADGNYRWHLVRAHPVSDDGEGDTTVRWVGTCTDIEDQKTAAEALAHLNNTLEHQVAERTAERDRMWRLSSDIMLVAGFDAKIVAVNPALTQLLGWQEAEIIGMSFIDLVDPVQRAVTRAQFATLGVNPQTLRFENRCQRKDDGYCELSWTAVADQDFIHAVGRDVTADKDAAAALRRSELALQQAQKMETIGKLTGGVAHDFNNLLQVISGNLQLLSYDIAGNPQAERRIEHALGGVRRGAKLASQLLAFGRRQPLEPKTVKVGRIIVGMEDMLRRTLGEAVEIEIVVSGGLWNTCVDPAQVENAVLNLAINARDAMDGRGKLTIEVGNAFLDAAYASSHSDVEPGQYVLLAVTDTGTGMTPEVLAQAFEPFFSTKPEGQGSGLGLSMVYGFVKQSGGHVKIYSEQGQGTTIKLYMPRAHGEEDVLSALEVQPAVGGRETILVAEDDDEVRATVVEILQDLGYSVLTASDAASALTVIDSGAQVDLLFTDVVMPGPLRSPDLARKARERLPNLAVLFTSGYTENAIVHGGRVDAGVDLLGKPYTQEALARKLRHVFANQAQKNSLAAAPPEAAARGGADKAPRLKILLVEDDDLIRENTVELLRGLGHWVVDAAQAQRALTLIDEVAFDVLITDLELPGMSGEALAHKAREMCPDLALVFATGYALELALPRAALLRKPYDGAGLAKVLRALAEPEADVPQVPR